MWDERWITRWCTRNFWNGLGLTFWFPFVSLILSSHTIPSQEDNWILLVQINVRRIAFEGQVVGLHSRIQNVVWVAIAISIAIWKNRFNAEITFHIMAETRFGQFINFSDAVVHYWTATFWIHGCGRIVLYSMVSIPSFLAATSSAACS